MLKILEPFEVRAGNTTAVGEQVGNANDIAFSEDFLSGEGSGAVSTFEDSLALNNASVLLVEGFLNGGGDEEIAGLEKELGGIGNLGFSGAGEAFKGTLGDHVVLNSLNIETFGVMDSRVVLDDGGDLAAVALKELGGPVADSAEALNDEGLVLDAKGAVDHTAEVLVGEHLTDAVVYTETSGLSATVDATLLDEFASAAAFSIDVLLALDVHVGVLDPGHNLLVGAHIGAEAIDGSANKALLDELHSVLAGYTLKLTLRQVAGINFDATLAATEGNISNGEFEGHEAGKSLNLLEVNVVGVTSATLARKLVSGVLSSKFEKINELE